MPDIQDVLDDCQKQCDALVKEIESFKAARQLNEQATKSLDATSLALGKTARAIEPFTAMRMNLIQTILLSMMGANTVLFLIIMITLWVKG